MEISDFQNLSDLGDFMHYINLFFIDIDNKACSELILPLHDHFEI